MAVYTGGLRQNKKGQGVITTRDIKLEGGGTITTSLETYALNVLPKDVIVALRGVSMQELEEQVDLKNEPTNITVDGRDVGRRGIFDAQKRVTLKFGSTIDLIAALKEAYALLQKVTRIQSPAKNALVARKNFYLMINGRLSGRLPFAFAALRPATFDEKTVLRVVGPLVPYGRVLYWHPIGRSYGRKMDFSVKTSASGKESFVYNESTSPRFNQYSARSLRRLANRSSDPAGTLQKLTSQRAGYVEGANQIVKRIMRKNKAWTALHISDGWVPFPPAKKWGKNSRDDRVPSVSVQMSRKGQVRLAK